MEKPEFIKWGMIGCGDVTEKKSGPSLNKVSNSRLVAVMARTASKVKDYAHRHDVPKWTTDAADLLHDPDINAVYIATPPNTHKEYTLRAAQAGKPVYVEKPMARTFSECTTMIAACRKAGVPLFVAYYRRCLPNFLKVKELIDSGAIGKLRFVAIQLLQPLRKKDFHQKKLPWRVLPGIAGGGYFVDLASHQFDFLNFVLGPICSATGKKKNQAHLYPAEDIVSAVFEFNSGVYGTGIWCFTTAEVSRKDEIKFVGSDGEISFSTFDHTVPILLKTSKETQEFRISVPEHIQQPLIETIVAELLGNGVCPSTGETAAQTNRVMDDILKNTD